MIQKAKQRFGAALGVMCLAVSALAVSATPAQAAVSGTVWCDNGSAVQGIWIDSSNSGQDGWASWSYFPGDTSRANYSLGVTSPSANYRVNVGCGGWTGGWQNSIWSGWYTGSNLNFICHVSATPTQQFCYPS